MSAEPDRPSGRAVERLATGVGDEVSGLRNQLRRALDEAERLQAAGREDLAVTVLEEQRDALVAVHRQLETRLADAIVEREAEGVLAAAATSTPLQEAGAGRGEPAVGASLGEDHMGLRLVAAAAAAVLGVALLLTPEAGPAALSAAGASTAGDAGAPGDAPRAVDEGTTPTVPRPAASAGDPGEPVHVRDAWALALVTGAPATPDNGHDGADLAEVLERLPLPSTAAPLDPFTVDPTALVVEGDATDDDSGRAGSDPDPGGSPDDGAAGGDGEGTSGSSADGAEPSPGEPEGGAATDDGTDGTDGTDATGPSGGATSGGETDGGSDDEAPDDGGSMDLDGGEVTPGLER